MLVLVAVVEGAGFAMLGGRRMGLGVQFDETVLYRPDLGFVQSTRLNKTNIESQIDRFLKDGKKPVPRRDDPTQADIVGLQILKVGGDLDDVAIVEITTEEVVIETVAQREESLPETASGTDSGTDSRTDSGAETDRGTGAETVTSEVEAGFLTPPASPEEASERDSTTLVLLCALFGGLGLTLVFLYYKGAFVF